MLQVYEVFKDGHWQTSTELPKRNDDQIDNHQPGRALLWVDLLAADESMIRRLAEWLGHDPRHLSMSLEEDEPIGISRENSYTHFYLNGICSHEGTTEITYRPVSILCAEEIVITIHSLPLKSVDQVQGVLPKIAAQIAKYGPGHLRFLLRDKMSDRCVAQSKAYEDRLENLEDRSISAEKNDQDGLLEELSNVRREVLDLWRNCVSQREVLIELCEEEFDFISEESARRMERVRDHMTSTLQLVELLRGMVSEVRENYRTTLNLQSSEATKKLTVFAGVLLPMSTIAALYGMNVPLWPNPNHAMTFWQIIVVMFGVAAIQLYFFWRQRWL